jgi:hypothetical protein
MDFRLVFHWYSLYDLGLGFANERKAVEMEANEVEVNEIENDGRVRS